MRRRRKKWSNHAPRKSLSIPLRYFAAMSSLWIAYTFTGLVSYNGASRPNSALRTRRDCSRL